MGHDPLCSVLQLFNEKVGKLESLSLWEKFREEGAHSIAVWDRGTGWDSLFVGPDDEAVDALVLTLRFFVQNNESTSLENMEALYGSSVRNPTLVNEFRGLRAGLNKFLDTDSHFSIEEGRRLKNRDIFEIFLWGGLAHANEKKYTTYKELQRSPFFPSMQVDFVSILVAFRSALRSMRTVNLKVLDRRL